MDPAIWAYLQEWLHLLLRWLHVTAAIAWVGTSFYFIALDRSLGPAAPPLAGESWEIHGGGFYRVEKYRVAPAHVPEPLHWFKWEAYLTWLSGFSLLVLLYYLSADTYLTDPAVRPLEAWQAVAASIALLALGWLVYDQLEERVAAERVLVVVLCVLIALVAWISSQLFSARAMYIQTGAVLGTWMAANVFFVIIPGQRRLVAATAAGREPDARDGTRGKRRSVHNNYFTLPAIFAMISQHFPFTYGSDQRFVVLLALMAFGALVQHLLNVRHDGRVSVPALAGAFACLVLVVVALAPLSLTGGTLTAADFPKVQAVVGARCITCHSAAPTYPGILAAPKGVLFDTPAQMHAQAQRMYQMVVVSRLMPLNNLTGMTDDERDLISRWVRSGAPIP